MSRTPLFRLIHRSLRLAHYSLRVNRPAKEIVEEARDHARLTRRQFLAASATLAATSALEACGPLRALTARRDLQPVCIVGAGLAGLTAAYRLKQAGVPVRLLEAQNRVGGRILTLNGFFPDGQTAELGGEFIDSNHQRIRALAAELGLGLDDLLTDDPSLARDIWYFRGQRRSESEVVEAFRPIAERIASDLATTGGAGEVSYRNPGGAEVLDRLSIAEWLDRAGASGWIRDLLDVGYRAEYGLEIGQQSALNLLLLIDPKPEPFHLYGESDERFHVNGGNARLPEALASRLETEIEVDTVLEAVRERADGSFLCAVRRGQASFTVTSPHVVLAIPFTLLRSVQMDVELPPVKRRAIRDLGYGANAKLLMGFTERLWRGQYRSTGSILTDLPFQMSWETSRLQAGPSGILTNFAGGDYGVAMGRGSVGERVEQLVAELEKVFPGIGLRRSGKEVRYHWPSARFAQGSYTCYLVGQYTGIRGAEGERVRGLHFAGEHCSMEAQGFMEGGCETGETVAREILAALGLAPHALWRGTRGGNMAATEPRRGQSDRRREPVVV